MTVASWGAKSEGSSDAEANNSNCFRLAAWISCSHGVGKAREAAVLGDDAEMACCLARSCTSKIGPELSTGMSFFFLLLAAFSDNGLSFWPPVLGLDFC